MTTAEYISLRTNNVITLIDDLGSENDQGNLTENQYFALMVYADYQSYLRNYIEYQSNVNKNPTYDVYDIGIEKLSFDTGYYISKTYRKRYNPDRGRVIIVQVNDLSKCIILT